MNSKIILITVLIFFQIHVFSQEIRIKILDSENLAPITYAHILFDDTGGTITNSDGEFIIDMKKSKRITISHVGYESKEILSAKIKSGQPIILYPKLNVLDEVKVYSIDNLMKKITAGLKTNYASGTLDELMFFRVSLMKNKYEGQMSEGYIQVQRNKYFDRSKDRKLEIQLNSNRKINNLKNIDFHYYNYQKILQLSESFINLRNGYYKFNYIEIDTDFLKIEFSPKEKIEHHEVVYDGFLVINTNDYAIVEFQYTIAEIFKKNMSKKEIGTNMQKKDVNASKLVKWNKDAKTNNYQLSFLRINDELIVEDLKNKKIDKYIATYELYNLGNVENFKILNVKKRKTNSKKNVFEYSNLNSSNEIFANLKPILRNKKQDSLMTILNEYD